jgi:hypothetical protein
VLISLSAFDLKDVFIRLAHGVGFIRLAHGVVSLSSTNGLSGVGIGTLADWHIGKLAHSLA